MKKRNLAMGAVATVAVLAVTLTSVMISGASAAPYHRPYHHPVHRVVAHRYVHPVSHRIVRHDDHPHH